MSRPRKHFKTDAELLASLMTFVHHEESCATQDLENPQRCSCGLATLEREANARIRKLEPHDR